MTGRPKKRANCISIRYADEDDSGKSQNWSVGTFHRPVPSPGRRISKERKSPSPSDLDAKQTENPPEKPKP